MAAQYLEGGPRSPRDPIDELITDLSTLAERFEETLQGVEHLEARIVITEEQRQALGAVLGRLQAVSERLGDG